MAPFRDRHLAAGFIIFMYLLVGALLVGFLAAAFSTSDVVGILAACVGGILGAALGLWRIHRTPEEERADENGP